MAATNKRGVFSLETVLERQSDNHWSKIPEVFRYVSLVIESAPAFGYLAGGKSTAGNRTSVDRIDYGNDTATASPKGPLAHDNNQAGTGNQSFGYTAGSYNSKVNRIDYSNDSATAIHRGSFPNFPRSYISAVGNRNFGYWCGGENGGRSWVDRLDYSNDSAAATPKGNLSAAAFAAAGTGNQDFGYIGGFSPSKSLTSRIDYSNDTATATTKGALLGAGYMVSATGSANFGYWSGGNAHGSRVGRLDYANDSQNMIFRGNVTTLKNTKRSATGSGSFGYITGGDPAPQSTIIDRIDYSNDTSIAAKGNLTLGKYYHAAVSAQENALSTVPIPATRTETGYASAGTPYGYWAGGQNPYVSSIIQRLDFSNDTGTMSGRTNLSHPKFTAAGSVSSTSFGYFVGGYGPANQTGIDRLDYSNDTATATPTGTLTHPTQSQGSAGTNSYGYIAGGQKSPGWQYLSSVQRLDYSSDSSTTSKGPLNVPKVGLAGMGNSSYGWFAGGVTPGSPNYVISKTDRVDYSNDTATSSPKGDLSRNVGNVPAAAGNSDYGWISGGRQISGFVKFSTVDRIDYSNDTATATPKGPLPATRYKNTATGNTSYGWHGAGKDPSGRSNVYRIDYSNDTASASTRGPLAANTYGIGATSSRENALPTIGPKTVDKGSDGYQTSISGPNTGYWAGGGYGSVVDRVDFSNDTATASARGNLSVGRTGLGNGGSTRNHGYAFAGSPTTSSVDRVDYSNDSATASPKGPLSYARSQHSTITNINHGYTGGGWPGPYSTIDRLDYANDTATAASLGNIMVPSGRDYATTGNQSYGYLLGGYDPSLPQYRSTVRRIDYSNDTATTSPRGSLRDICGDNSATGNANYGFIKGGANATRGPIEVLDFANDTATPATTTQNILTVGAYNRGATGSADFGYFGGGDPPNRSYVDRIDYSNYTAAAVTKGPLTVARGQMATFSAREHGIPPLLNYIPRIRWVDSVAETPSTIPNTAYVGGGTMIPGITSTIERIDYSNDTATASTKGPLTEATRHAGAFSSSSGAYFSGGQNPGGSGNFSKTDRLDYSNDTATATSKGNLPESKYAIGGINNSTYGWAVGGNPNYGTVYRLEFASDTTALSTRGAMSPNGASYYPAGTGNENYGYMAAGVNSGGSTGGETPVDRIDYSNDTSTPAPKGKIRAGGNNTSRYSLNAGGNNDYGYFYGGDPGYVSKVDRLDFSNDTATAEQKANLPEGRMAGAAAANSTHAYLMGGIAPGHSYRSTVTRIDFSNDTSAPSPKGPLTAVRAYSSGASARSNAQYQFGESILAPVQPPFPYPVQLPTPGPSMGYFAAGSPGPGWNAFSGIDRIQFSNDTATASPKGALTASKYAMSGCGTKEYGYIGAGGQQPGPDFSTTDRIDYSNDTATALVRGSLNRAGRSTAAASNTTYGYWAGGMTPYPTATSKVSRLTFASDTGTQVAKGNLTTVRRRWHATGNQSYGYFAGGGGGSGGSRIDRIDYTNDTPTAASKGPLTVSRSGHAAAGNASFGYFINGFAPLETTSVERLDYSSDTTTASPKGPLTSTRAYNTGTGSPDFGYVAGGWTQAHGQISYTDRIEYSNDTATASPKGKLNSNPYRNASVSARAYGLP